MKFLPPSPAALLRLAAACLVLAAFVPVPAGRAQGKKKPASAGSAAPAKRRGVPPKAELSALVRKTLLDVDKGLETKDFTQFYNSLAPAWRKSLTKESVSGIFALQLAEDQRSDYAASVEPVYDPAPFIDERGLLVAGGHVPSEPQWVLFRIKYYNEGGWKPFGIALRVQNSATAPSRLPEKGEKEGPPAKAAASPAPSPAPGISPTPGASPATSPAPGAAPAPSPAASPSPSAGPSPAATAAVSPSPSPSASPSPGPKK